MIYDNIDRGVYDLSNDKSGIRVGNEQYCVNKPEGQPGGTAGNNSNTGMKIGQRNTDAKSGGGCCGWKLHS